MDLYKIILNILILELTNALVLNSHDLRNNTVEIIQTDSPDNVFNGVYTECFLHLSYSCLQKKTLLYLKELNNLSEVSVIGDYVKFVKVNTTISTEHDDSETSSTDELAFMIDKAVDDFFDNHVLKFNALGRDISIPRNIDEFVGRKKRKGGGGGDGMMGGHGHDDKKKMMMMGMMCMKMKLMMMIPAMMGMMGMMSFKGMMFSMMSFMISKVMLLMKILEKKGGAGVLGGGGGGGDGGWAAAGGGGGAWVPAGGQDFSGGGGYDANGQWQSRSIAESLDILNKPTLYYGTIHSPAKELPYNPIIPADKPFKVTPEFKTMPEISYVKPVIRFNNKIEADVYKKPVLVHKKSNVNFNNYGEEFNDSDDVKTEDIYSRVRRNIPNVNEEKLQQDKQKSNTQYTDKNMLRNVINESKVVRDISRNRRSILDLLQNSYAYWMTTLLGLNNNRRTNFQKHKIINGVRYVYYPYKAQKTKMPKEVQLTSSIKLADEFKPVITAEDFNKGEIMEGAVEARMHRKKFHKMKDTVNETLEDNPWQ